MEDDVSMANTTHTFIAQIDTTDIDNVLECFYPVSYSKPIIRLSGDEEFVLMSKIDSITLARITCVDPISKQQYQLRQNSAPRDCVSNSFAEYQLVKTPPSTNNILGSTAMRARSNQMSVCNIGSMLAFFMALYVWLIPKSK
ncbi:hypothetical protein EON65_34030 [archaeon]|nr:MAG: hypothetical protein EON65_34030 [archaeon]